MTRLPRLLDVARKHHADAIVVVPGANLRYLTTLDYHAGERLALAIIPTDGEPAFVLPQMEAVRVNRASAFPFRTYPWSDAQPAQSALQQCISDLNLANKTIAVEHLSMRLFELRALEAATPGVKFIDANPILTELRIVKDAQELSAMREAARMIDATLHKLLPRLKPGLTERQVASLWVQEMLDIGSEGAAFECIIASGPNAAFPHHTTGDRKLEKGDLVILDGGCKHHGYLSDITRTVALGQPTDELKKIYDTVKHANAAGKAAARPGTTGKAIDAAARKVIVDAGYGEKFTHRTGHGLGLDVHEPPYIAADQTTPLPVGCVFTIEPGIYIEGLGGTRIEDDVVMTESGSESLTAFPRDLITL